MNREELIGLRKQILKVLNEGRGLPLDVLAAQIVLVFEQAHAPTTPTDDERTLIEQIKLAGHLAAQVMVFRGDSYPVKAIPYTSFLHILGGFRRTVQGEP
jgi:hypothetical protein